ncbi:MAG: Gfo/Idh/MocA family protein [Bryobacteraceae bacterium]
MHCITRREALAGGAALTLPRPRTARAAQANSAVAVGIIGTGGRGRFDGAIFAGDPRARIIALCDINPEQIDKTKTAIPGTAQARVYKDYRELLADKSIDAVLIATPVFLHPEHFEAAVNAGKHIYIEKPAGADVAGVKRLLAAALRADKSKTIVFGFQNHFSPEYRAAEEIVRTGKLGDLLLMECHFIKGGVSDRKIQHPPEERIRHWGAWRDMSGDIIVEQDCHGLDILNWFAKAHPIKAVGSGGRKRRAYGDNMDHLSVTYEYPGGLRGMLVATQVAPPRYRDVREQFFGTKGVIETHRQYYKWDRGDGPIVKVDSKREITIDAVDAFLGKVVAGTPENTAPNACESTFTSLLGRMAIDAKREVTWEEMLRS